MKVVLENIDLYRYEIHSLIREFYPEEEVKVIVEGDPHVKKVLKEEERIFLTVEYEDQSLTLFAEGKEKKASLSQGRKKSSETKDVMKKLLYELLSELTGKQLPWGDLIGIRPTKLARARMEKGDSEEKTCAFLMENHKVSRGKALLAVEIAKREMNILSHLHDEAGYSLYIGIPFCPTTCLYCSFPSYNIAQYEDRIDDYLDALSLELKAASEIMKGVPLDTIYIGGGTPTSLSARQLDRLLSCVETYYDVNSVQEFSVEAGRPDSMTREKFSVLRHHPVTRISVNPQTMQDKTLRLIGRHHSVQQVKDTFYQAREYGFSNINMDMILGLPTEDKRCVEDTVSQIEALSPDSLTVHSLAVKRGSRLRRMIDEKGYPVFLNTEETVHIASQGAARMGMKPYYLYRQKNMAGNFENVGYAREGAYGIYNILIMEEIQSIMAVGAGSVTKRVMAKPDGTFRIDRCEDAKDLDTYLKNLDEMVERKRKLFSMEVE